MLIWCIRVDNDSIFDDVLDSVFLAAKLVNQVFPSSGVQDDQIGLFSNLYGANGA